MRKSIYLGLIAFFTIATANAQIYNLDSTSKIDNSSRYSEINNAGTAIVLFQWGKQKLPLDSSATQKFTDVTAASQQLTFILTNATPNTKYFMKATVMDSATGMILKVIPANGRDSMTTGTLTCPTLTVTASAPATICSGSPTTLTATGALTYSWSSGQTGSSIAVSPTTNTTYTVTGADINNCIDTGTVLITVDPAPIANIASNTTICNGGTVTLTASGGTSYQWSSGPTTTSITVSPTGTTSYSVTVSDPSSCSSVASATVTVNPLPNTNAGLDVTICSGNSATLSASGGASYLWSTGATTTSIIVSPTVTATYTVTGISANGCAKDDSVKVTVNSLPAANIASNTTICAGSSATLLASGGGSYLWNTGATAAQIVVTPAVSASYSVMVTGLNGCQAPASASVTVNPLPTITITPSQTICNGITVTLSAAGAVSYSWMPAGQTTASISDNPSTSTFYIVTGTDANGCSASVATLVTVNPVPNASASGGATLCIGSSTTLSASGGSAYSWSPSAGLSNPNISNPVATPTVTTTYTVTVTSSNCSDTASVTVVINNLPVISVGGAPVTICSGSTTTMTASGALNYLWSPGSQNGSAVSVSPSASTVYTVTGVDAFGCAGINTASVTVIPTPTVVISNAAPTICANGSVTLNSSGAATYAWAPAAGLSNPNISNPVATPSVTTTYTLTGTGANGCFMNAFATITVISNPTVTVSGSSTVCAGSSVTLTAAGSNSYSWSTGSTATFIAVNPTSTASYTVVGTDLTSCSANATATVTVTAIPVITASTSSAVICTGNSVTLTATGGTTYTWNPGAQTGSPITASPTTNTTYTVVGTNSGCSGTATVSVAVDGPLTLNGNLPIAYAWQPNYSGSFSVTGSSTPCTYSWTGNGNLPPGLTVLPNGGFTGTASTSGFFTFEISVTNTSGCIATQWFTIQVKDPDPIHLQSLSITTIPALSPAPTVTATVTGGVSAATVGKVNGSPRTTVPVAPNKVAISLLASDVVSPTQYPINVETPGYPPTNSILFTVTAAPPATTTSVVVDYVSCGSYWQSGNGGGSKDSARVDFTYSSPVPIKLTFEYDFNAIGSSPTLDPAGPLNLGPATNKKASRTIFGLTHDSTYAFVILYLNTDTNGISNVGICHTPPLGVEEVDNSNIEVSIFPNPLTPEVSQLRCDMKEGTLAIYDVTGREVMHAQVKDGKCEVANRPVSGFYFVQLFDSDQRPAGWSKLVVRD